MIRSQRMTPSTAITMATGMKTMPGNFPLIMPSDASARLMSATRYSMITECQLDATESMP
jgi:hypothetical protein